MSWAVGGLFEGEDREKYQKWIETRNAPLPPISSSKTSVDKETVFIIMLKKTQSNGNYGKHQNGNHLKESCFHNF